MATVKNKDERDCRLTKNTESGSMKFNKIKVGKQTLSNDVVLDIGSVISKTFASRRDITKDDIERAIKQNNYEEMRRISRFFFKSSGIYSRLCRYMAFLFKYDWFITPCIYDDKLRTTENGKKKVVEGGKRR